MKTLMTMGTKPTDQTSTKADITFSPGPWMTPEEHAESRRRPKKRNHNPFT